mmetsp:Transcript_39945/g.95318  ORF Transcript_39945/g.95318 Transcript_39945/m.95318 type:complete len:618 (-) Transcript_39945:164-2017(-)
MAVTFVSLLLLFLVEGLGLKFSDKQDFDYDHLQRSIVRIETVGASFDWFRPFNPRDGLVSLGSGFIVQTEPYILIATNQHVINDALRVQIQLLLHSQAKWDVNIVSACPKFDLALLTLKSDKEFKADLAKAGIQLEALTLSKKVAEMGQDVVALGFPLGQNSLKISKGNVAGNEFVNSNLCIQSTAPISPGNSGGPLLDDAGSEVLGVNFAGATRGENINYVIPAFRVQALVNLHLKEQLGAPWRRLGFRTPGHGLTTVHPNQALYNFTAGCKEGVYIGRVRQDGFMSKAQPEIRPGSMLVAVNGKALDGFGKADIKELMLGKAALDDLFFIQPDLEAEVSFETCFRGTKRLHKVSTIRTPDFDKGIRYVDEPVTEGLTQQYEIFGDIGVMSMTQNHVGEALARTGSPRISRWLLPDKASEPRLMVIYVRPGSYASEVIGEGSAVEKVNGRVVRTLEDFRKAIVPDAKDDIWTLETDLGLLLATPFKATLSAQLVSGAAEPYLLTPGIKQAALKIGHSEHSVKSANTTQGTRTTTSTPKAITPKEEEQDADDGFSWFDWLSLLKESRANATGISSEFLRRTALLQSPAVKAAGPLEVKNFKSGRGWETGDAQAASFA